MFWTYTDKLQSKTHNRYHDPYYNNIANYLSNPNVDFEGVNTGSLSANNAKVLKETRFRSAAVGDESLEPPGQTYLTDF